ncbi:MAG: D-alanyl-D-alanine carboxypeptidase [Syntrophales bacterium]|nr:D-alanyl-D-alanine carboxypeptidase [Syntrophales bacterium]MDD5232797.1 D-alanyl-D-alanine carboxypeptidase [Syntrophales bacterium]
MIFRKLAVLVCIAVLSMLIDPLCGKAAGAFPALKAKSAILMNMNSGAILYSQDADRRIQPASITKVLSLYLVHEAVSEERARMDDLVKVSRKAWRTGGSRMYIREGWKVPLEDLVKGMAVVSGNDACVAVAEHFGGVELFVQEMNRKAREIGMTSSHFVNPNGLPAKGQFTTARDVLKLSKAYLTRFPESLSIHSMRYFTYGHVTQRNHNRLLQKCEDVDGLKTGYVRAAGYHIVATAKRGETRLIAVVMGTKNPRIRTVETRRLLDEGFRMVGSTKIAA